MGYAEANYDIVNGTGFLTSDECERVNYLFTNQYLLTWSGETGIYKQDRGQLMTNFLKWVDLFFYRLSHGTGTDSMEIGMVLHGFKYF